MDGVATKLNTGGSALYFASVKSTLEGRYVLTDQYARVSKAKRAAACLLKPEIGDQVLVTEMGDHAYILSVLERGTDRQCVLELDGDTELSVKGGNLSINADEGMALTTPFVLSLCAQEVALGGQLMSAAFEKMDLLSGAVSAQLTDIKLHAKQLKSKIDHAMQSYVGRHVNVDTVDTVKAGSITRAAKNLLNLHSAFAFIKAKKNVKIDGKQIFMG